MSTALTHPSRPATVAGVPPAPPEGSPKNRSAAKAALQRQWRYSLRWANPYTQPTGPRELASALVPAGSDTPAEIQAMWQPGTGYAITIDFDDIPIQKWSPERKGKVRRARLASRLQKQVPLFAEEFQARELASRPGYYRGE